MVDPAELGIATTVLFIRFVIPLFIPKFPLPAIIACLIVDAIDQTVFQQTIGFDLGWYQGYDKALDIYYLVIAYLSSLRNWRSNPAFQISRFLLYYRLVGVVLFELTGWRALLLIFPNTFEYFFIFYEGVRSRWNPLRFGQPAREDANSARHSPRNYWLRVAAAIWIFIKLPQEWWIHIAQLDVTDVLKANIFGVSTDASFGDAIANRPWVAVAIVLLVVLIVLAIRFLLVPRLPASDHPWQFAADPLPRRADTPEERREIILHMRRPIDHVLLEKIFLVTLVSIIFAQILPDYEANNVRLTLAVAVIVTVNSFVSYWFARRGYSWQSAAAQFIVLFLVNTGTALIGHFLLGGGPLINVGPSVFLLLLLTLLITLYDYFRPIYSARFENRGRGVQRAGAV